MTFVRAILPLSVTIGLFATGLIAYWYIWPRMLTVSVRDALIPLLFPHSFRYIGLSFLIRGVTANSLGAFGETLAYGDLLTCLLALIAIVALRARARIATVLVWVFSCVGLADFTNAFVQGLQRPTPGDLGASYYIPMLIVPLLIVSHVLIIARLRQGDVI